MGRLLGCIGAILVAAAVWGGIAAVLGIGPLIAALTGAAIAVILTMELTR